MDQVRLGVTDITVQKNGFGALPLQRVEQPQAVRLLRKAFEHGITFFDTARMYTNSEEKLSIAFEGIRQKLYIATKTTAKDAAGFWRDLDTSLLTLKTDYVDLYQFHNPAFCPKPGGKDGLYDAMTQAKAQGKIRHIGITNHRLNVAMEAIQSGLYETLQFHSVTLRRKDIAIAKACEKANWGSLP